MKTKLCMLVALYATGCGFNGKDYTYVVSTQEDIAQVQQAADMWNKCGTVNITVATNHENDNGMTLDVNYAPDQPYTGMASMTQIRYKRTAHTYALIAHEIGHTLGLKHSHSESDIMSADLGSLEVSDKDCESLLHRDTYYTNDSSD